MEAQCDNEAHALLQQLFFTWALNPLYFSDMIHCGLSILLPKCFSEKKRILGIFFLVDLSIWKLGVRCFQQLWSPSALHQLCEVFPAYDRSQALPSFQGQASAGDIIFLCTSNLACPEETAARRLSSPSKGIVFLCWDCQEEGPIKVNSSQGGGHLPSS